MWNKLFGKNKELGKSCIFIFCMLLLCIVLCNAVELQKYFFYLDTYNGSFTIYYVNEGIINKILFFRY